MLLFEYTVCMLRNMRRVIASLLLCIVFALCVAPAASLASSLPAARDILVMPGTTESVEIPISSSATADRDISLLLFSASFQQGIEQPRLEEMSPEIASWVSLSTSTLMVPAGASVPVVLSVRPPADASPQVFIFALVATEKLEGEIALIHGSATLIFVSVGSVVSLGSCESFIQDAPGVVRLSLSNSGNGILYDDGEIVLRGMFGVRLGASPSNPKFHRTPPEQTRTWQAALPPIPWWAIGPLSYSVSDAQLDTRSCPDIYAGTRWLPLVVGGIVVFGAAMVLIRRRTS